MSEAHSTPETSRYDPSRTSYVQPNGDYVYGEYVLSGKQWRFRIIETISFAEYPKICNLLAENDRYMAKLADRDIRNIDNRYKESEDEDSWVKEKPLKLENIPGRHLDPHEILTETPEKEDPRCAQLERWIPSLTPSQQELYYRVYGEQVQQATIAAEDGVTRAAVSRRLLKIERRAAAYLGGVRRAKQIHHRQQPAVAGLRAEGVNISAEK